ncbi:hypothetical protein CK501_10140 [Halovibrio salipaludis]|uniref:Uncharacterized protein n=1 Tax=Halovibrio salipaludis TaxID=2032626 RepID=A0A2A2F740_9GAMM|nr:hypothetical protein CK501_10140 [Halovibrio salipaludis]
MNIHHQAKALHQLRQNRIPIVLGRVLLTFLCFSQPAMAEFVVEGMVGGAGTEKAFKREESFSNLTTVVGARLLDAATVEDESDDSIEPHYGFALGYVTQGGAGNTVFRTMNLAISKAVVLRANATQMEQRSSLVGK